MRSEEVIVKEVVVIVVGVATDLVTSSMIFEFGQQLALELN